MDLSNCPSLTSRCWKTHLPLLGIILQNLSEDALVKELDKIAEYVASILVGKPFRHQTWDKRLQHGCKCRSVFCNLLCTWEFRKWQGLPCQIKRNSWIERLATLFKASGGDRKGCRSFSIIAHFPFHAKDDGLVPDRYTKEAAQKLKEFGFQDLTVKLYNHSGHFPYVGLQQAHTIRKWITEKMEIGSIWVIRNLEETPEDETYVEEDFLP